MGCFFVDDFISSLLVLIERRMEQVLVSKTRRGGVDPTQTHGVFLEIKVDVVLARLTFGNSI